MLRCTLRCSYRVCCMLRLQPRSRWDDERLAANRLGGVFGKADAHSRALLRRTYLLPPSRDTHGVLSRSAPPYCSPPARRLYPASSPRRSPPGPDRLHCAAAIASNRTVQCCRAHAPLTAVQCILCARLTAFADGPPMQDGSPFATELLPENAARCLSCKSAAPHRAFPRLRCVAARQAVPLSSLNRVAWDSLYDVSPCRRI